MRILILSANTGGGHNSCSKAMLERFNDNGHECVIADCLSFISPIVSKIISNGHTFAYRYTPYLFNIGYNYFEKNSKIYSGGSFINNLFASGGKKLACEIDKNKYDIIICAHAFAVFLLDLAAPFVKHKFKSAFIATDFTCSPTAEKGSADFYFIPHKDLVDEFTAHSITRDKLYPSGIPVKKAFYNFYDKQTAKQMLGINPKSKHLLVMCGSMGCGPIASTTLKLARNVDKNTQITVICGSNVLLKQRLKLLHRNNKNVHIIGFTNDISLYMDSADIYITKPGGISLSEGTVKKLPMVLLPSVGGCETHNLNFYLKNGAALSGKSSNDIVKCCTELLNNEAIRKTLSDNLGTLEIDNAATLIFDFLTK